MVRENAVEAINERREVISAKYPIDDGCYNAYPDLSNLENYHVPGKLATQIKQSKPWRSAEEEAFLNLLRTADALMQREAAFFGHYDVSHAQYNVLRILRGAGQAGLPCGEIANRMITRDPDITRLLDRLEKRGLAARSRESVDRRVVTARITQGGLEMLESMDEPLTRMLQGLLGHLGSKDLKVLIDLLERAREKTG
jgi:DNA-binding MarR family transcriptional regulator